MEILSTPYFNRSIDLISRSCILALLIVITGFLMALRECVAENHPVIPMRRSHGPLQHILFVGDSFTHGRYTPIRLFNSCGKQDATTGFNIEAISETSLRKNYAAAASVIDQAKWNAVVFQELSVLPLPDALSQSAISDPSDFCDSVQTIEQGVHAAVPSANVFLYETWPPADIAEAISGSKDAPGFSRAYTENLAKIAIAYHNAYYSAAAHDGQIAAVAPVGEAWIRAWVGGIANPNPFTGKSTLPVLWYGINATNNPVITVPDDHHPSIYGAYLSALVLFEQITGRDVRRLGPNEMAATQLGIAAGIAVELQQVAWESVTHESDAPINQTVDPCTLTH